MTQPRMLHACAATHPGRERPDNEDAFGIFIEQRLFVVADGMGGRASGDVASRMAVESIDAFFRTYRSTPTGEWPIPPAADVSMGASLLYVALKSANQRLRRAAEADQALRRMGATAVAMAIGETQLVAAHVGDARLYRLRGGTLSRLTRDHSLIEEMQAARPEMTAEELAAMAPRNLVTRALGIKDEVEPTVYMNAFAPGDLYLLCTDGLWGCVGDAQIAAVMAAQGDLERACQALVDAANAAGGPDNVTALLVRID